MLLINIAAFGQKNLSSSLQRSVYTYVYRINLKEAERLYRKGIQEVSEKQLYALTDSFTKEEPSLSAGNYLFVHADDNNLVYELKAIGDVSYKIINNSRDLVIALHTKEGRLIKDATVSINNKALRYDQATQTYRRDKYTKEGTLQATVAGVLYRFPLKKGYAVRTPFFQRLAQTTPLKFIINPFRKLFAKNHRRYNFYYSTAHEQSFKGFLVFNQPKYKPGDTVRLKAFVTTKSSKPVDEKLWLRLSERSGNVDTVIASIAPYRAGGYEHSFVLSDSLSLDLDKDYLLTLEESSAKKKDDDDDDETLSAKRKVVMRGHFYFEEYELDAITFSARSDKKEHSCGETVSVYAKASDANDMAVMDGRIKLIVKSSPYSTKTFTSPIVFLPDTLWQYEGTLEPLGETKINIPDSIFPHAGFDYQIECIFLNSNNERQIQTLSQTFSDKTERIAFDLQGDSLHIDYLVKGRPSTTSATLYGLNDNEDTLVQQDIRLPATIKADAFVKTYEVETDSLDEEYEMASRQSIVSALASRTADSVAVQLVNPSHLPVWYTVFAGNKVVLRGYGDSLTFVEKARTPKHYFVSLQYILGDKVHNEDYTVPYRDKLLIVRVHQPEAVYPGQTATIEIEVRDAATNPVSNADVTAYAFTKKFDGYQRPNVPYLGKLYPSRKRYATFTASDEEENLRYNQKLAWERWSREMQLDTIEHYKFLHPQTLYINTEPAADSLTQLAPFVVKDGSLQAVHHLYIDEVPVFFSAAQSVQRYSFAVSPGKHSLRLRTYNAMISVDSFDVAKGVKTVVSINADTVNHRIHIQPMPDTMTAYEKAMWGRYSLLVQNTFGEHYAYINSGNGLFLLNNNSFNPVLLSPLPNRYATLTVKNGFTQSFEAEGGYHYFIEKGLIKQKQLKNPYPFSTHFFNAAPRYNFRDYVLTEYEIDSLWQDYLYNRSASTDLFTNPIINKTGNGALQIGVTKDSTNREPFIRNVLLFRYDDPDFLRIYRGAERNLGFVQPGKYRLLVLLKNDSYFICDSINIKKDGINYYETGIIHLKPKDSVSSRISDIINSKERWTGYNTGDFNGIKESFNQQYFDASLFTETVSGVVKNDKGVLLAGVSIFIKGTRSGTTTDSRGEFVLRTLPNSTLVVSSVGYVSIERRVKDGDYSFKLSPSKNSLQEVVIVGYGTLRRADLTGAISSVSVTGLAGSAPGILIRGTSSLQAASQPLIIVDGLPFSGILKDIDPSLIVSTNVLKDAAATAIYGDKAANGVIIITTKGLKNNDAGNGLESIPVANTLRKNFHDYAYWQPKLTTDAAGKASFTITYPDDITAWRGFAIAMTDKKQSGFAETMVKSFKAISGALSLPQFAVAGDTINVIGKSLNYLADSIEATRTFAVNDVTMKEGIIRFRNSLIDTFTVVAPVADSIKMKYTIQKSNGYFDGEERSLPIYKQGVTETSGLFAALRSDTAFTLRPLSDTGIIKLYAETSVIPSLEKEIESIRRYEYLCNEQLASKLKALLVQKRIDSFYKRPFRGEKNVRELIGKLQQSKTAQGLWGWWTGNEPTIWISLHVLEALTEAALQGYAVQWNKQVLIDYLVFNLESYRSSESLSALHLLQLLNAKADYKKYIDTLQMHLPKMNLYEKLRLAELKQKGGLDFTVDSLLAKQSRTMFGNIYFGEEGYRFFDNAVQNTLTMYRILHRMNGHDNELEKMRGYFLERRKSGAWRNTYESSLILETILPDMLVNDSLPKAAVLSFDGGLTQTVNAYPFATDVKSGQPITVRKEGKMPVYFTAYQQYWNAAPKKVSGDFAVTSTFVKNDDTITRLKAGEPVMMKIAVTVKADAGYVMIEAPIPAGCSYKDKAQSYSNNEAHREYFKNKVSIFCSELKKGTYTFNVWLLPRYAGRYTLNPAKAEIMYFPVFYGREGMKKIAIGN